MNRLITIGLYLSVAFCVGYCWMWLFSGVCGFDSYLVGGIMCLGCASNSFTRKIK